MTGERRSSGDRHWKDRLIDDYVSSGQAGSRAGESPIDPEALLGPRLPWLDRLIKDYLPADRNVRILDVGCGYGALLYALRRRGYRELEGIDASAEQVEVAGELGLEEVMRAEATEHLRGLAAGSRDVILAVDLLEHLGRAEALTLAEEACRVLASEGRFIVHVPNALGPFGPGVRWSDLTHEIAFTPGSVHQLLKVAGFDRIEVHPDPPVVHGPASLLRRVLWTAGIWPVRLLHAAETGRLKAILTRNLLALAKP